MGEGEASGDEQSGSGNRELEESAAHQEGSDESTAYSAKMEEELGIETPYPRDSVPESDAADEGRAAAEEDLEEKGKI